MSRQEKPHGLAFSAAVAANELEQGQIIVLDGHVVQVAPDPDDRELVRVTLIRALGPPPGKNPDQRTVELVCPRNMLFATAAPYNIDLVPVPERS